MPLGRVLTEETKKRIIQLIAAGLSDTEIGLALKISADSVRKIRKQKGEKKHVGESEDHHGSKQKTRSRGIEDPDGDKPAEDKWPAGDHVKDIVPAGESISFIGGKKHQHGGHKTMNKEKEELEWECPKCHHQFNGEPKKCPKCGADLQE